MCELYNLSKNASINSLKSLDQNERKILIQIIDGLALGIQSVSVPSLTNDQLAKKLKLTPEHKPSWFIISFFKGLLNALNLTVSSSSLLQKINSNSLIIAKLCEAKSKELPSSSWDLSKTEDSYLIVMENNPCYRAGSYLPVELKADFECIKNDKSAEFTTVEHHGQGTHSISTKNVFEFLSYCVSKDSVFREIIDEYAENRDEKFKCPAC